MACQYCHLVQSGLVCDECGERNDHPKEHPVKRCGQTTGAGVSEMICNRPMFHEGPHAFDDYEHAIHGRCQHVHSSGLRCARIAGHHGAHVSNLSPRDFTRISWGIISVDNNP